MDLSFALDDTSCSTFTADKDTRIFVHNLDSCLLKSEAYKYKI